MLLYQDGGRDDKSKNKNNKTKNNNTKGRRDLLEIICYICGTAGHYASDCPDRDKGNAQQHLTEVVECTECPQENCENANIGNNAEDDNSSKGEYHSFLFMHDCDEVDMASDQDEVQDPDIYYAGYLDSDSEEGEEEDSVSPVTVTSNSDIISDSIGTQDESIVGDKRFRLCLVPPSVQYRKDL